MTILSRYYIFTWIVVLTVIFYIRACYTTLPPPPPTQNEMNSPCASVHNIAPTTILLWIITSDGDPQFQHTAVQRQTHELLTCRVVSDEKHDAVFTGRFDLELDAELLHVEIRCRGHGQERPLAQKPDVGQPLLPATVFSGPACRTVALVTRTHRHARRPVRAVVSVCVTSVVPVRTHRTIPPIVAHAPERKIIISLDSWPQR